MPLLNISTNKKIKNQKKLLEKSSYFISTVLNKPENYVMVKLIDSLQLYFAGTDDPCCIVEIKSIGSLYPSKISKQICEFFSFELEIPSERIYVLFQNIESNMWVWNNKTFG